MPNHSNVTARSAGIPGPVALHLIIARAAKIAVVVLTVGLLPVTPTHAAETRTVDIVVKAGKVIGAQSIRVSRGDNVVLRWNSDQRLQLHLHGYDVEATVTPGVPTVMKIQTRATGRFPVELHGQSRSGDHGHAPLFYLEVYPD